MSGTPFGATLLDRGGTRFALWAPGQRRVGLQIEGGARHPMQATGGGWHELVLESAGAGTRYRFVLQDGLAVPDPASRFNPDDVHGPSMVLDPRAYRWRDRGWRGRPWHEAVIYELHVGTFTEAGSFAAAEQRLPELAALGITAVELMPLADFPGRRGWGYDGVLMYAPDAAYGTPDELKHFIDTAHGLGLMVLLDVVYNHFGPDGNYLHAYCPQFFNPRQQTPWGAAINFDGEDSRTVRDFYVHNALHWISDYHFDGLRLDAVHAIRDDSPEHIVTEIARALRDGPGRERHVHLVLENDANEAHHLERDAAGKPRSASAQWNDDLHHAAHVVATGERDGYYADYAERPLERFGRALAEGFVYQGEPSTFRGGEARGEPSRHLPGTAFVSFLQNHDQIGNRAFGERIPAIADPARLAAAQACVLLAPQVPLLFMGEEYAASTPFLYFCDFQAELAQAVTNGRRAEFERFAIFADAGQRARIPDPNAESTFRASKLRWQERDEAPHRERLAQIAALLAVRREHLVPRLAALRQGGTWRVEGELLHVQWSLGAHELWHVAANFGTGDARLDAAPHGQTVLGREGERLAPGEVRAWLETDGAAGLLARCAAAGLRPSWSDVFGQEHHVDPAHLELLLRDLEPAEPQPPAPVSAGPERCWLPPALEGDGKVWGPALQLYALRSARNWGIGDFADLAHVVDEWASRGAGIVGLNPLHALFAHNPAHASPYSPSSRQWLNTLYIDVEAVPDFAECDAARALVGTPAFQRRLAALRDLELVDHPGVAAAKSQVLRLMYASFRARHVGRDSDRVRQFERFRSERGKALRQHASFEALQGHFHAADASVWGWPVWPEAYRDAGSDAVARFVAEHIDEVEYHEYLQWQADCQLAAVSRRCRERGMAVGLYLDLAVSVDRAGSDAWGNACLFARHASIGAPPDEFNPNGQNWGLPPLVPSRSRASGHALLVETLRAVMRHAGALRIDHVMALSRLYWIAEGRGARDGAYVHYPFDELLALVAAESRHNRCLVIGEDLGTVSHEVREGMARSGMLSYRLVWFERDQDDAFTPPARYPAQALVALSTHDLPTLAGWWSGRDLALRLELSLFPDAAAHAAQVEGRAEDKRRLVRALQAASLLPDASADGLLTPQLVRAVHAWFAASPSKVAMLQLEDALRVAEQANLPGTTGEHPNWRRKLPLDCDRIAADPLVQQLAATFAAARPRAEVQRRAEATIPRATYRLQFHAGFGFDDAVRVLPYLARLGISHIYNSPIMRARAGSMHGYDIVAHDEINPELGGRAGFERYCAALRAHGMGQLLDMVPNHMGVLGAGNAWWNDVLENGTASAHARHFDIDWHPANRELEGKVLVPVLGAQYGDVLANGELAPLFDAAAGSFALRYFEHTFPLDPGSYPLLIARACDLLADPARRAALHDVSAAFARLPERRGEDAEAHAERARDAPLHKARLARLVQEDPDAHGAIDRALAALARDHDSLDRLLEAQAYRLAYWRVAGDEINYRRFFDINELAALRIEEPEVFEATQSFALDLAAAGVVDGLRIDHPDGLHDPAQYFRRLQQGHARRAGLPAVVGDGGTPLYVVVEKIAAAHEDLPADWAVHGTTGYRFAMLAGGVLVAGDAGDTFERIWARASGEQRSFERLAYDGRRAVMRSTLAAELSVLATELLRIARADRRTRDYTWNALRDALAEVVACMPVYRTYIVAAPSAQDVRYIDWAVAHARRQSQAFDASVFSFVRDAVLARARDEASPAQRARLLRFAMRFQQYCSPVAAKGVEDTAFYRYHRLVSLNEVGGDPETFGITVRAFHGASADRAERWPHTMLATSTHDNKRSEDVRNRIHVLSEMPETWRRSLTRWMALGAGARSAVEGGAPAPSAADEVLLYQTLLGTLPPGGLTDSTLAEYRERIETCMLKAVREAKLHTSWINQDAEYEGALLSLVRALLVRVRPNPWLGGVQALASRLAWYGALNSLSMAVLKFTSPGVPDTYQGNEIIDLSLVDPDNRRPVDYTLRARMLDGLEAIARSLDWRDQVAALLTTPHDGRAKLWVTWRLLEARRAEPVLFERGSYAALATSGARADHVIAYAREFEGSLLIVICGRLFARLLASTPGVPRGRETLRLPLGTAVWGDTAVQVPQLGGTARLHNLLTGETMEALAGSVPIGKTFATFPAAVLRADRGMSASP